MKHVILGTALAVAAIASAATGTARAQGFPARPVTIVVPYAAGGGTDAIARRLGQALSAHWKQSVVVENVPGADGVIGTQRALRAPPDGHTLLVQLNQMLLWPWTVPSAGIDILRDVQLISKIQHSPQVIAVPATFPGGTVKEFAAWCAKAAPPCSWGSATQSAQLAGTRLMASAGVPNAVNVPYKGTTPMIQDVVGGHIAMGIITVSSATSHVRSGALKLIAIGSRERFPGARDVPTLIEQGFPIEADTWYGLMVARETPRPVVDAIVAGVAAVAGDPELLKAIEAGGGAPILNSPQAFRREVEEEIGRLEPILGKRKPGG